MIHYKLTQYGFEYGSLRVIRVCSDEKKGWVDIHLETPKADIEVYVTKTGKVRIWDRKTSKELK